MTGRRKQSATGMLLVKPRSNRRLFNIVRHGFRMGATIAFLGVAAPAVGAEPNRWATASYEVLVMHAAKYGKSDEQRAAAAEAKNELLRRGHDSFRYTVSILHYRSLQIFLLARFLRRELPEEEVAEIMVEGLKSEHLRTRRLCAFELGKHDLPQYAEPMMSLLNDDEAAGSAIRTLGKWKVCEAVPGIVLHLTHEKERRRVVAINALREIGDSSVVPYLFPLLRDPIFTVRQTASEALATMGGPAEQLLLGAMQDADVRLKRLIVQTLGRMESRRAVRALRRLIDHEDPGMRGEVVRALRRIDPEKSERWLRPVARDPEPFVATGLRDSALAE